MKEFLKDKYAIIKYLLYMSITCCIVFILIDIKKLIGLDMKFAIYLAALPIGIFYVLKNIKKQVLPIDILNFCCKVSSILYIIVLIMNLSEDFCMLKAFVAIITVMLLMLIPCEKDETKHKLDHKTNINDKKDIFGLYYINTEKVYEIAMLMNNKIVTGGSVESAKQNLVDEKTSQGIKANLEYLHQVKGELNLSKVTQIQSELKKRVLENFDVKTTKSNMLSTILHKAKIYKKGQKMQIGDLLLIKDAKLQLLNSEDTYAVTKLLLNGAFNGTKLSGGDKDVKIELNLSALINSLLKDCTYEMLCQVEDEKFGISIPMTLENDFENSYNIYDLQVGKVDVLGIYKGEKSFQQRLNIQEILSNTQNNEKKDMQYTGELKKSNCTSNMKDSNQKVSGEKYQNVIDVIAVIQVINIGNEEINEKTSSVI